MEEKRSGEVVKLRPDCACVGSKINKAPPRDVIARQARKMEAWPSQTSYFPLKYSVSGPEKKAMAGGVFTPSAARVASLCGEGKSRVRVRDARPYDIVM